MPGRCGRWLIRSGSPSWRRWSTPARRAHTVLQITTDQDDPSAAVAADELSQWYLSATLDRAHSALSRRATWPA